MTEDNSLLSPLSGRGDQTITQNDTIIHFELEHDNKK